MASIEFANPDTKPAPMMTKPDVPIGRIPTTIESLPAELLCLIFDECFEIFKSEERGEPELADPPWHFISDGHDLSLRPTSNTDRFERFKSPSRFPYGLAAVSPFWKEALSTQPIFWQQAILYLNPRTTKAWNTLVVLEWSRDLPIDVVILRDTSGHTHLNHYEASIVKAIIDLLYPHLPRCRSIYLETNLGSSLPLISELIRDHSPMLSSLLLGCQVGDTALQRWRAMECGKPQFKSNPAFLPRLMSLVIDGRNFDNTHIHWLRFQTNLEQLVISNYPRTDHGVSIGQTLLVIAHLPNLLRLKLHNVEFDIDPKLRPGTYTSSVRDLHLDAVSPLITQELFRLCDFDELDSVSFTRCIVEDLPYCNLLVLDDIKVNSRIPLAVMLVDWEGSYLWIGNCRGFNDDIFDMLRNFSAITEEFRCPWVERLYLFNLPSFSLKKLKKMIKRRNQHIQYDDPDWVDHTDFGPAIKTLLIEGCDVRELTPQDMEWFTSHVAEFSYVK